MSDKISKDLIDVLCEGFRKYLDSAPHKSLVIVGAIIKDGKFIQSTVGFGDREINADNAELLCEMFAACLRDNYIRSISDEGDK